LNTASVRVARCLQVALALVMSLAIGGAAASEDYAAIKQRLVGGDTGIDFLALRMSYAASPEYSPNRASSLEQRRKLEQALKLEQFEGAVPLAEAWLKEDYLNPFAHLGAARAYEKTGKVTQAKFHNAVVDGLFKSICAKGEGQSENTPCRVVSIDEEHFFLAMNGFKLEGQHGLMCAGERSCEVFDVTDRKTGKGYSVFMDISLPLKFLEAQHGNAEAPPPPPGQ